MSSHKRKPRVIFVKSAQTLSGNEVENTTKELTSTTVTVQKEATAQSDKNGQEAAQSGAEEIDNSNATQPGAKVMDNSDVAQPGAEEMGSSKAAQSGAEEIDNSNAAQPGAKIMDSSKAAEPEAEEINFDNATQARAEKINNSEATKSGAEKINNGGLNKRTSFESDNVDVADSQSLEILTLQEEINMQVEDNPGPKMRVMWQNDCNDDDSYQMSLASHMPEIGNANHRGKATTGIRMLQEISQERKMDIGIKERTKKSVMYRWFRQPKKTKVKKFKPEKTPNEKKKENGKAIFNLTLTKKTKDEKNSEKANTKFNSFGQPKKTKVKTFKEHTKTSKENNKDNGQTKLDQIRNLIRQFVSRLQEAFFCRQI